jgi:predicted RNA-binding Zn-ribbon protein involved in translation (DUF1610 family)
MKMCREEIVKVILKQIDDDSTTNNFEHSYWFICTGCLDEVEMVKKENNIFECPDCKTEFVEMGGRELIQIRHKKRRKGDCENENNSSR